MTDRQQIEPLVRALYAARVAGQLDSLCGLFASDARLRIAGSSDGKPIAITARGIEEIRPWLAMLVKTFRLIDQQILSTIIEGRSAAVHWRAGVHSKITGAVVPTELVDLIEVRDGRIAAYREFFVPD
jgi:ketosteroid isomerase-like protein